MGFDVAADAYDRFMGRYSRLLAPRFADWAGVSEGPALDIGCGPGALVETLAARLGPDAVAAVDPSESFVAACRTRVPGADVRRATAEAVPFGDREFAAVLSQLVLSFVRDPPRMAAEMTRVARPGGVVAACTWEAGGVAMLRTFWRAAKRVEPAAKDESDMPFRRAPELMALWQDAGLRDVETDVLEVNAPYANFDDFWLPMSAGVGPVGDHLSRQPDTARQAIRDACFEILGAPAGSFSLPARAIAVRGRA